jgi:hypothetical protein
MSEVKACCYKYFGFSWLWSKFHQKLYTCTLVLYFWDEKLANVLYNIYIYWNISHVLLLVITKPFSICMRAYTRRNKTRDNHNVWLRQTYSIIHFVQSNYYFTLDLNFASQSLLRRCEWRLGIYVCKVLETNLMIVHENACIKARRSSCNEISELFQTIILPLCEYT